jgi:hypothetical protein
VADEQTLNNVRPNTWVVYFGADKAPYEASANLTVDLMPIEIKALRSGGDILGIMVGGRRPAIELTIIQSTKAELKRLLHITANAAPYDLPDVGTLLTGWLVRLHDPLTPDGSNDVVMYAGVCTTFGINANGESTKNPVVRLAGLRDANGKVLRLDNATGA